MTETLPFERKIRLYFSAMTYSDVDESTLPLLQEEIKEKLENAFPYLFVDEVRLDVEDEIINEIEGEERVANVIEGEVEATIKSFIGKTNPHLFDLFLEKVTPILVNYQEPDEDLLGKVLDEIDKVVFDWFTLELSFKGLSNTFYFIEPIDDIEVDPITLLTFVSSLIG